MSQVAFEWWNNLRHGGLLLDMQRLSGLLEQLPEKPTFHLQEKLRRKMMRFQDAPDDKRGEFISFVLEDLCGFTKENGNEWFRGTNITSSWSILGFAGDTLKPQHLWVGQNDTVVPIFIDNAKRLGIGRGKRIITQALQWLRKKGYSLAIVTNGFQWRLIFAGLDYDAFCEWETAQWFSEGEPSEELLGFLGLLSPGLWISEKTKQPSPLLEAINETRKGQSDLSQVLGERIRQAAEMLIQAHTPVLNTHQDGLDAQDIYRASVRMIMRLVVILFAESREGLLPRDNTVYHSGYSLQGMRDMLERVSPHRLAESYYAYPRILSLINLLHDGSAHEALPVPAYGGELFAPGAEDDTDGMKRALWLFENSCFVADFMSDLQVRQILNLLTRTKIKIRQGRSATWVSAPVDFSSLDSEYIGILYEGLLDFVLSQAAEDEPVIFLAVGNQPALPLKTLEQMDDRAIKNLLEKMKDTSSSDDEDSEQEDATSEEEPSDEESGEESEEGTGEDAQEEDDTSAKDELTVTLQGRAESWAKRACEIGGLVRRPRGQMTPERQMQYEQMLASKARQLVVRVVLPGEWYLIRWGGTRKGSGTFYTRPQLAIPTVHRTLQPLAYNPPAAKDGVADTSAQASQWLPKKPEEILSLKVCDPACGSGSFPLAALRYLTEALYNALIYHKRIRDYQGESILELIYDEQGKELLKDEKLPCRPDDDRFESLLKAVLRRYIVERCIYGVDLDPLAVELCRLSLWIETLDRNLPLTFLNHKIKCGNSLVGAWLDQFKHYPAMAWTREGGDKSHTNGVYFEKEAWSKAIKEFSKQVKSSLIDFIDGNILYQIIDWTTVKAEHDSAVAALSEIHELGITQVAERAEKYRELICNPDFVQLKETFDLWCALWFWPQDKIEIALLPTDFAAGNINDEVKTISREVASQRRFFHWELEFPDVFNSRSSGFDAVLGNPPWDISKPNSKEYFSAIDPLYRSYGKQDAIRRQKDYFQRNADTERAWLEYNAYFKAMGNWNRYAGYPFGDRVTEDNNGKKSHDLPIGDRGRRSFETSENRHKKWRKKRQETAGYADTEHAFRHQGGGDVNLYKMFLEQTHAILQKGGRLGFIVPSGLYSDYGTGPLRELFLENCRWEWLFGFENRDKVFDIDSRFKFNPVIIEKGGKTNAIRTAFMRRKLADWENAEDFATEYTSDQVLQFSPKSKAILEIQSQRDLEVLTKIYENSVLLGDDGPDGWGIKYSTEFHMTNDSKLFPPRPKWEEWGYRPDEYSRWIKGSWRPIEELYAELNIKPLREGELRCAQPPYDKLPIPRADIPEGIILSRNADAWIRDDEIPIVTFTDAGGRPLTIKEGRGRDADEREIEGPAIALPLYQGVMIGAFDSFRSAWVSGTGLNAKWNSVKWSNKLINSQFLINQVLCNNSNILQIGYRDIARTTDTRTMICSLIPRLPCGNKVPKLSVLNGYAESLQTVLNSYCFDWVERIRQASTSINYYIIEEMPIPLDTSCQNILRSIGICLGGAHQIFASDWLLLNEYTMPWKKCWALTYSRRFSLRSMADAVVAAILGLRIEDFLLILAGTYHENTENKALHPKGFWRVDKDKPPEQRLTVLSLIAFHDLQEKIDACGGNVEKGIEAFCNQNDGEGWMLPETLRLADYGLGHDDRAKEHQPVRECFGPRYYDWQLAQSPEESWRECHLHARNLLGADGYQALLDEIEGKNTDTVVEYPIVGDEGGEYKIAAEEAEEDYLADLPLFSKKNMEKKNGN